jgi:hypothetical protein
MRLARQLLRAGHEMRGEPGDFSASRALSTQRPMY